MEYKKFIKRSGTSLIIVLLLSSLAVFVSFNMLLIFKWAVGSTGANRNKINERMILESLISEGYHWLRNEIEAGRADSDINIDKNLKLELDDLKIFSKSSEHGAYVSIYNMSYDIAVFNENNNKNNIENFSWLSSNGAEKFFPPKSGAFLIRAVLNHAANSGAIYGKMLEVIITRDNRKWLWEETWF